MASNADFNLFSSALEEQDNTPLFKSKKWIYVSDTDSKDGDFTGSLTFDLNTLATQSDWINLSEAVIQFPIKQTIRFNSLSSASGTTTTIDIPCTIKNGFHSFVDSVQITLGNSTISNVQNFTNIDVQYKMLTEMSYGDYLKYGPSLGFVIDDHQISSDGSATTYTSLENRSTTTVCQAYVGYMIQPFYNAGIKERVRYQNIETLPGIFAADILGPDAYKLGRGTFQDTRGARSLTSSSPPEDIYVQFIVGTIRLKDLSDAIAKMPPMKGLKGSVRINYNSARTDLQMNGATSTSYPSATPTTTQLYGRIHPGMLNVSTSYWSISSTTVGSFSFTSEISAVPSLDKTSAKPAITTARLIAPAYQANVEVDRALSTKKVIRHNERFITTFSMAAGDTFSDQLTPGVVNPTRVILFPYLTGTNATTNGLSAMWSNPLQNPWTPVPGTTGPFAAISDLQINVGGVNCFQEAITMDHQMFMQELAQNGLDGSLNSETTQSSILDARKWSQMHRYYTADLSRRGLSDDGSSKSIRIQCKNATTCPMTVIAIIWYQREVLIDTALGTVERSL